MTLKVHLSDASTHQPLSGVTVQLFTNHTSVTTETTSADGNTYLRFPYRLGTPSVVVATRPGYVPNSVPWTPSRLPGRVFVLRTCDGELVSCLSLKILSVVARYVKCR